jgi:flagellar basal-body rod protein FlgG
MNAELLRQDVVSNNLANVSTVGFKKDDAVFEAFPNRLLKRIHDRMEQGHGMAAGPDVPAMALFNNPQNLGVIGQGVKPSDTVVHFSDGSVTRTDRPLDLALQGNALFTVERADGSIAYTRNGNFTLDGEKHLVTMAGDRVLAASGAPLDMEGSEVVVDAAGGVKVDGVDRGKLQLAAYDPSKFTKLGENLYVRVPDALEGIGEEEPAVGTVHQGYTEQANVQVVEEMVRMISVMRAYEANQKSIQMQDDSLARLISQVGGA